MLTIYTVYTNIYIYIYIYILLGKKYENFGKVFAPSGKISAGAPDSPLSLVVSQVLRFAFDSIASSDVSILSKSRSSLHRFERASRSPYLSVQESVMTAAVHLHNYADLSG